MNLPALSIVTTTDPIAGQLPALLTALLQLSTMLPRLEVIVVDDLKAWPNSQDNALPAHEGLLLRPVWYPEHRGQAAALLEGARLAQADIILTIDPDMHSCVADIPEMLKKLTSEVTIVHGVRQQRADAGWVRRMGSAFTNRMVRTLTGIQTPDIGCSMALVRKSTLDSLAHFPLSGTNPKLYAYSMLGQSVKTHPLSSGPRAGTPSQYSTWALFMIFIVLLRDCLAIRKNRFTPLVSNEQ